mgnify:CR=1 FL=1
MGAARARPSKSLVDHRSSAASADGAISNDRSGVGRAEELSFLHLECARIGHEATGLALLRGCLAQLADHATDALLHFYRSHRAATRAKLYVWRASEPEGGQPGEWLDRAGSYVRSANEDSARSLD